MKHEKIKKLLPLYIDNELTEKEKKLIKNHLQECKECREELKKYRENYNFLSSLKKEKAPAELTDSVLNKVNKNKENKNLNKNKPNTMINKIKNFFTFPVKIPAGVIGLIAVILLISFSGLPLLDYFQSGNISPDIQQRSNNEQLQSTSYSKMDMTESVSQPADNQQEMASDLDFEQKIIKRANLTIESNDLDEINKDITNLVEEYNGYILNSRNWSNQNQQKFYRFELKVPADNFIQVVEQLSTEKYGEIISRSLSSRDVTEEYMDLDTRLKNLISQEDRYRQLLDKAEEVEEILKIENELTRIRTDIERLQGRKKYLDNQISYSTITVDFREPEPIGSGSNGIIKVLRNAVIKMVNHFYNIIILIGTVIPYLLLIAATYFIIKSFKQNK